MKSVVFPPVLKFLTNALAHDNGLARRDRDVVLIKQGMEIASQQETVRNLMQTFLRDRDDVRGLERRQRSLASYDTSTIVGLDHTNPKGALPKTRSDKRWRTEHRGRLCKASSRNDPWSTQPLPNNPAFGRLRGVSLAALDMRWPIRRQLEPFFLREEYGLRKDSKPYCAPIFWIEPSDCGTERSQIGVSVLYAEGGPGKIDWQQRSTREYAIPCNEIDGRLQLEDKQLTRSERPELQASAGLPMIDLVKRLPLRKEVEPGQIRVGDEKPDHARSLSQTTGFMLPKLSTAVKEPSTLFKRETLATILENSGKDFVKYPEGQTSTAASNACSRSER